MRPCQLVCRPGWQLAIRGSSLDGLWRLAASGVRWMAFVDLLADLTSAFLVGLPWCVLSAGICRPGWHRQSAAPRWMAFGDLLTGCAWLLLSWLRCPGASLSAGMSPRLASAIRGSSMDGLWRLADWLCLTSAFKELPGWVALVRRKQLILLVPQIAGRSGESYYMHLRRLQRSALKRKVPESPLLTADCVCNTLVP